jgi:hypothetical protein
LASSAAGSAFADLCATTAAGSDGLEGCKGMAAANTSGPRLGSTPPDGAAVEAMSVTEGVVGAATAAGGRDAASTSARPPEAAGSASGRACKLLAARAILSSSDTTGGGSAAELDGSALRLATSALGSLESAASALRVAVVPRIKGSSSSIAATASAPANASR